jgi:hypothetical protein
MAGVLVLGVAVIMQFVTIRNQRAEIAAAQAETERLRVESDRLREIPRQRAEMVETGRWLHQVYQNELKRPQGLWIGDQPDFEGIGAWLLDVYLTQRIEGATPEAARQRVIDAIQQTEEWQRHHPTP